MKEPVQAGGKDAADSLRERLYAVIFEHHTRAGKAFDVALIVTILLSVAVVMADSVEAARLRWGVMLWAAEWGFTILFSIEYALRLYSARDRAGYARSFFGIIDLIAILPTWVSALLPQGRFLIAVRIFRVLRVFRVLKLAGFLGSEQVLLRAIRASRYKIMVFLFSVLVIVVAVGSIMYLIEGPENGFTSIPRGVYWAIVTLTTVGYGDVAPQTPVGQALASLVMILGFGIIAVPTGIVTVELGRVGRITGPRQCVLCGRADHDDDARFCKQCGTLIAEPAQATDAAR